MHGYTAQQVREAERPHLEAGEPLMERASRGLAERIRGLIAARLAARGEAPGSGVRVLVLVGSGSNGGDGLFAGALLAGWGHEVIALTLGSRVHEAGRDAAVAAGVRLVGAGGADAVLDTLASGVLPVEVVMDALLGTGAAAGAAPAAALRGEARRVVQLLRAVTLAGADPVEAVPLGGYAPETAAALLQAAPVRVAPAVVAVDLPSGLDPDTGDTDGLILPADLTVTFGGVKAGLLRGHGPQLAGEVVLVPIGIEADLALLEPAVTVGSA
ncbi:NAD(P)H-hydrate epimerase [Herbiconiux moechotypicola]|uniref:NAD(P)H-hydrate epimerase n=1 Tax=Herbiconiux moechotypicola TaxID=637393 RepID=A0ABN3DDQ3_9MICO|nr:NAD(P)H-hydrate epimerase [Herbiconiux moechotypicola]MCS5729206.1 NAD(P)H-hydrate epimerase [Herbiconiux moechotypicola]